MSGCGKCRQISCRCWDHRFHYWGCLGQTGSIIVSLIFGPLIIWAIIMTIAQYL